MDHEIKVASLIFLAFGAIVFLVFWISLYLVRLDQKRSRFIRQYHFPSSVRHSLKIQYPEVSGQMIDSVLNQLRTYFLICKEYDGKPVAMPSKLVDSAWHSFILSTQRYQSFCKEAFGWYLHHLPEFDGQFDDPHELGRAVKGAKLLEGSAKAIPMLFTIDAVSGLVSCPSQLTSTQIDAALADFEAHLQRSKSESEKAASAGGCSAAAACGCGGGSC
jgi:hypothetical protein